MPRGKMARMGPGTVLFIAANPTQTRYAFAEELHDIEESGLKVASRWSVGVEEIPALLDSVAPDVVHVLSPGVDAKRGLMLADPRGRPQYVKAPQFARAFAGRRRPRLVVLNTCDSAGYARALAAHADSAIGMDGVIDDRAAVAFAQRLYRALAAGESVSAAFERGRSAVEEQAPAQRDVPALFGGAKSRLEATTIAAPPTRSARRSLPLMPGKTGPAEFRKKVQCVQLFCSYSHKDAKFRAELEVFLAGLRTQGLVHLWHDRLIQPGADWAREIDDNLDHADIVLLLVSADFMASQYCMGIELKRALQRSRSARARVIPILVRTCDLEGAPFSQLQWLPTGAKPVKQWRDRDAAWTDVAKGVRKVVADLVAARAN